MSNEFTALRARARERRDKIINQAKADYEAALKQIAALEQDLLGKESTRHKKISACIDQCIPRDRTFTTLDILAGLEALDPGRVWRPGSINNYISQLRRKGLVRRLRKSNGTTPAIYVRAGVEVPEGPLGDLTLREVVARTLTRPMNKAELLVAILESGYRTNMNRVYLQNAVGEILRKGGYQCEGGKWTRS